MFNRQLFILKNIFDRKKVVKDKVHQNLMRCIEYLSTQAAKYTCKLYVFFHLKLKKKKIVASQKQTAHDGHNPSLELEIHITLNLEYIQKFNM